MADDATFLGRFDRPVLVFGGTYGNLEATTALFAEAAALGIPPERMIHTGDVVAYCADPQATVDLVRESGVAVVMGNCEESLGAGSSDCGCGFAEGGQCDTNARRWYAYCDRELSADAKTWMAGLPRRIDFDVGKFRLAAFHGAPSHINRFVFASTPETEMAAEISGLRVDGIVSGHSGIPFVRDLGSAFWVNAGVVGMPANDGTRRVWYALLSPRSEGIAVAIRHLDYDWAAASGKLRRADLPRAYAEALETGLWDSNEILPPREAANRGQPLKSASFSWVPKRRAA